MQSAAAKIELELAPGEKLLWSGQPKPGIQFRGADALLVPFGLIFLVFSLFWEFTATRVSRNAAPAMSYIFMVWGLPFIAVGLYLSIGRFFFEARRRERTSFGITNRRLIIVTELRSRQVRSLELPQLTEVQLEERRDGSGTIRLGGGAATVVTRYHNHPGILPAGAALEFLPRVREPYEILQAARTAAMQK